MLYSGSKLIILRLAATIMPNFMILLISSSCWCPTPIFIISLYSSSILKWNNLLTYTSYMQIFCHYVVIVLNFELLFNTLKAVSAYVLHANIYSAINQVKDFIPLLLDFVLIGNLESSIREIRFYIVNFRAIFFRKMHELL